MKRFLYKIFVSAVLSCVFASCDFLKENPSTAMTQSAAYATENALEAQMYGCLEGFYGSHMMMGYMNELLHSASGLIMWKGQRTQDQWVSGLKLAKYSNTDDTQKYYSQLYAAIARCNRLLDNLCTSPVDEAFKAEIDGEARFYRAVLYFYLVRMYGDVPLVTKSATTIEQTNNPRTPYYRVYAQILEDLKIAEESMRDQDRVNAVSPGKGRPCKWAATAMKSTVYMTIGSILTSYEANSDDQFFNPSIDGHAPDFTASGIDKASDAWTKAFECSEDVIANGPYELAGDYRRLFRWDTPEDFNLAERIFVIQSTNSVNSENRVELMSLPAYPEGSANVSIKNNNAGRYRPTRFFFQKFAQDCGGIKGTAETTKDIYVSCPDPRFDATFFHTSYVRSDNGRKAYLYPHKSYVYETGSTYSFPYLKKYLDPRFDVTEGYADFYVLRFAEMYLVSAEAAANLSAGPGDAMWQTALDRIESIHSRARNSTDGSAASWPTWKDRVFADKDELVTAIFWERMYEMFGEGHEWFDTHRMGARWMAREIAAPLNAHLHLPEQGPGINSTGGESIGIYAYNYLSTDFPEDYNDLRKSLLCAFPSVTEGIYNTAIDLTRDQNDYYWQ